MSQIIKRRGFISTWVSDDGEIYEKREIGRYLTFWDGEIGEPESEPDEDFEYMIGDYFVVGKEGDKSPNGEGEMCKLGEVIVFSGDKWVWDRF